MYIADAMQRAAAGLGTLEGYSGCAPEGCPRQLSNSLCWQAGQHSPSPGVAIPSEASPPSLSEQSADGTRL